MNGSIPSGILYFLTCFAAYSTSGDAVSSLPGSYMELSLSIYSDAPTLVEIMGVSVSAHSNIACGPPSCLDETIYISKQL